jgi:hypothetical protein
MAAVGNAMFSNAQRRAFSREGQGQSCRSAGQLPGDNLWEHMNRGTLTPRILKAAGSEYRRAHHFKSEDFGSGWSHGDASRPM